MSRINEWTDLTSNKHYLLALDALYDDVEDLDAMLGAFIEDVEATNANSEDGSGHVCKLCCFACLLSLLAFVLQFELCKYTLLPRKSQLKRKKKVWRNICVKVTKLTSNCCVILAHRVVYCFFHSSLLFVFVKKSFQSV